MCCLCVFVFDMVSVGDIFGFVLNDFGFMLIMFYLYFEIKVLIEGEGIVYVLFYMLLVVVYECCEEGRGEVVEDDIVVIVSLLVFFDDIDIVE